MLTADLKKVREYIGSVEKELSRRIATEETYRPALKDFVQSLDRDITVTIAPRRIECGAPDFIVTKGATTVGYIEAKDVGKNLDDIEQGRGPDGERFSRYRASLGNIVLTDYLEFRWFVKGECQFRARLGTPTRDGKIRRDRDGIQNVVRLLTGFLSYKAEGIGTAKELAKQMARMAHLIRELIIGAFKNEPEGGSLHAQLTAFRDNLIPDLTAEQFADMYAQTIAYGLFAARCRDSNQRDFTRLTAAMNLPPTNPFLRKLFQYIAGYDLDDRISWLVDDLVQMLAQAKMEEVLKDFGKGTAREDPVVHFYETFLKEYDPKIREMRGVYYTPEPVVSYIVRSIDYLLKTRFGKPLGLADDKTLVLDPAVGTGTFLYMTIREIYQTIVSRGQQGLWNQYVREKLLPRVFGFELLMAPYAVAHLKLGLLLQETGYRFEGSQRLGIYLTNTLEEAFKKSEQLAGFNEYIVEEANAAAEIKKEKPIMVVLGNPPYSGHSANKGEWARRLVAVYKTADGKPLSEKNPKWLQDDYVKFLAFGQWRINETGQGILAFITNHAYLDNPTFRGMRQCLMNSFTDIYILNLHGNVKKREVAPDGSKDENVFDIQQGVAIGIFVKEANRNSPARVHYTDLWGPRDGKYQALFDTDVGITVWQELRPTSPFYLFVPQKEALLGEYERGWRVNDIFPVNSVGIVTSRDEFVFDFNESVLKQRIAEFVAGTLNDDEARERFRLANKKGWSVTRVRQSIRRDKDYQKAFTKCLYRPFDTRHLFYHKAVIERPRQKVMSHMLAGENCGLVCSRQQCRARLWSLVGVANCIIESCYISDKTREISYLFPLYLYHSEEEMEFEVGVRRPNLKPDFIKAFSEKLGLKFVEDGKGNLTDTYGPEDVFDYAYAVFHSPTYRTRYAEFLRIDFPRLPLTSDRELFKALAEKGAELVSLHLMESPALNCFITKYPVTGDNAVERVTYDANNQRVYINSTQYFEGVPPEVWNFHIGGYQVCEKWLKDRRGRKLSYDELIHYQKIVVALKETIRLMGEIDTIIARWPLE